MLLRAVYPMKLSIGMQIVYAAACCLSLEAVHWHADCVCYCVLLKPDWRGRVLHAADGALLRALQCSWQDHVRALCSALYMIHARCQLFITDP